VDGFVSRDNPDPSARNFTKVCDQVGLERTTAWAKVPVGCVLNIGFAAPLFGMPGGGAQAEFVSGPPIRFDQTTNKWHSKHGNA
jgi:hypothetical protein